MSHRISATAEAIVACMRECQRQQRMTKEGPRGTPNKVAVLESKVLLATFVAHWSMNKPPPFSPCVTAAVAHTHED